MPHGCPNTVPSGRVVYDDRLMPGRVDVVDLDRRLKVADGVSVGVGWEGKLGNCMRCSTMVREHVPHASKRVFPLHDRHRVSNGRVIVVVTLFHIGALLLRVRIPVRIAPVRVVGIGSNVGS